MLVLNLPAFETKNTQLMTVSTETARMAKNRPRKNQSERSVLPCRIIIEQYLVGITKESVVDPQCAFYRESR